MLIVGTGLRKVSEEKLFAVGQLQDIIKEPQLSMYDLPAMSRAQFCVHTWKPEGYGGAGDLML